MSFYYYKPTYKVTCKNSRSHWSLNFLHCCFPERALLSNPSLLALAVVSRCAIASCPGPWAGGCDHQGRPELLHCSVAHCLEFLNLRTILHSYTNSKMLKCQFSQTRMTLFQQNILPWAELSACIGPLVMHRLAGDALPSLDIVLHYLSSRGHNLQPRMNHNT